MNQQRGTFDLPVWSNDESRPWEVMIDSPFSIFVLSFAVLWISAQIGLFLRKNLRDPAMVARGDLTLLLTATLTLLALIVGFTFSMGVDEYNQRRNSEQAEANALCTEYLRASLLSTGDASNVREVLREYLQQRILFYSSRDTRQLAEVDTRTARLRTNLWSAIQNCDTTKVAPGIALVVLGMNDVFSSQTYAQAAWRNRIAVEAWLLMGMIAICGNVLLGYTAECTRIKAKRFFVLPLLVSIAFFLVADLDNPRRGIISVHPRNLVNLSQTM